MAELETKKDKYGVAVAARIDPLLAQQIAERAMALQLSFSKTLGLLISKGFSGGEQPKKTQTESDVDKVYLELVVKLIQSISPDPNIQRKYAAKFKELKDERIRK
jgi:hypothetical protein